MVEPAGNPGNLLWSIVDAIVLFFQTLFSLEPTAKQACPCWLLAVSYGPQGPRRCVPRGLTSTRMNLWAAW